MRKRNRESDDDEKMRMRMRWDDEWWDDEMMRWWWEKEWEDKKRENKRKTEVTQRGWIWKGYKEWKIAELFAVSERTIRERTKDLREEEKEERNNQILDLYLKFFTQEEIADKLAISLNTVSRIIFDFGNSAKIEEPPESLRFYNVWNFSNY